MPSKRIFYYDGYRDTLWHTLYNVARVMSLFTGAVRITVEPAEVVNTADPTEKDYREYLQSKEAVEALCMEEAANA